ncbi:MAG: hypothetical protein KAQ64_03415 [Candidatus Pacebacteria bacterium]|nr:hypothetical protein [Candidatus Paceibacterota bacterium]
MNEVLKQKNIDSDFDGEKMSEEEKENIVMEIEGDKSLDPDTRNNAITAVKLFSVDYDDAIKIAEVVNLLWAGQKRFEYNKDKGGGGKTRSRDEVFIEKTFPIAYKFKEVKTVDEIPEEVICDIADFKSSYYVHYRLNEFKKNEKDPELFDLVESETNIMIGEKEKSNNKRWKSILDKLDQVNIDDKELKKSKRYTRDVVTMALIYYYQKQENIKERRENKFKIEGFENCDEISNEEVERFLDNTFGRDLLAKALVSKLTYSSKFATKNENGSQLFLNEDDFLKQKQENFLIEKNRFLGGSGASVSDFKKPTPVSLYNHRHSDLTVRKELKSYSENEKLKAFIFCSITHEIGGHNFYNLVLKLSERKEYEKICEEEKENEDVTIYISKLKKGEKIIITTIYDEDFSESMRRLVTDYEEFKNEFPMRVEFIEKKFPEIKKNGIREFIDNK